MYWLISLLAGLFFLNIAFAESRTTLYDFRFWSTPEHTRIVIDVDQGIRFAIKEGKNQFKLSILNAKILKDSYKKLFFSDQRILKARIKRDQTTYQFKFNLSGQYRIHNYTLKRKAHYP